MQGMSRDQASHPDTILQHFAEEEHLHGAVVPPIFQTSLFVQPDCGTFSKAFHIEAEDKEHYVYSRMGNPTVNIAERKIAALEGTDRCKLFGSGMAAISAAVLGCVEAGDHVVCVDTAYGPTKQLFCEYLPKFGVKTDFVVGNDPQEIFDAVRPNTKVIYLESPSSILFRAQDLEVVCEFARERGIATIHDNSYASPLFQQPARFGVDLVVHSATKYLGGHSDLIAGAVCGSKAMIDRICRGELPLLGGALAPFPAWLLLRGMRTLGVRVRQHQVVGNELCAYLKGRVEVDQVLHAGDPDHPQRALFEKQMTGTTGLLSFIPKFQEREQVFRFVDSLRLFQRGVSWGGFESLVVALHFSTLDWPEPRWVVRIHGGLEAIGDMIADLDQAFAKV